MDRYLSAQQNDLAAEAGVRLQGVCGGESVDLDLFRRGKQVAALDHVEMTGGAGAVAAALVFHLDAVFERRIQYRIAWRGLYGKAIRQKSEAYRRSIGEKSLFHRLIVPDADVGARSGQDSDLGAIGVVVEEVKSACDQADTKLVNSGRFDTAVVADRVRFVAAVLAQIDPLSVPAG